MLRSEHLIIQIHCQEDCKQSDFYKLRVLYFDKTTYNACLQCLSTEEGVSQPMKRLVQVMKGAKGCINAWRGKEECMEGDRGMHGVGQEGVHRGVHGGARMHPSLHPRDACPLSANQKTE